MYDKGVMGSNGGILRFYPPPPPPQKKKIQKDIKKERKFRAGIKRCKGEYGGMGVVGSMGGWISRFYPPPPPPSQKITIIQKDVRLGVILGCKMM